jgi:ATP-binding cassette subfamily B protein
VSALQIVEQGTHAELVEKDGLYAEMWRRQQETAAAASSSTSRPASTLSLSLMPGAQD